MTTSSSKGLRIDLMETEQGMFVLTGSPQPTASGERLIRTLADESGRMPNQIVIEGHTDSRPIGNAGPSSGYRNGELSSDRANAARRLLHSYGVAPGQVVEVRGFAGRWRSRTRRRCAEPEDFGGGEVMTALFAS